MFTEYLKVSNFDSKDILFILSVGGGDIEKKLVQILSMQFNIVKKLIQNLLELLVILMDILQKMQTHVLLFQKLIKKNHTFSQSMHSLIWHLIVTHPDIKSNNTKWETIKK